MISFIIMFILVPIFVFGTVFVVRKRSVSAVSLDIGLSISSLIVAYIIFRWDMASVHLRQIIIPAFIVLVLFAYAQQGRRLWSEFLNLSITKKVKCVTILILLPIGVYIGLSPQALQMNEAVSLEWPLEAGNYFVAQGGASELINHHYKVSAQKHGLDITALGKYGRRSTGVLPNDFAAYYISERKVLAPCDGTVTHLETSIEQQKTWSDDARSPAGNYVALNCGNATVLLGHLHTVEPLALGDFVLSGSVLGSAGSTGNSTEPHLHIHAVSGNNLSYEELLFSGQGLVMIFSNRILERNDIYEASSK